MERKRKFLVILQERGGCEAFKHFLDALKRSQQYDLYDITVGEERQSCGKENENNSKRTTEDSSTETEERRPFSMCQKSETLEVALTGNSKITK